MGNMNQFFDKFSEFLAARKGLPIIIGIILVVLNGFLQFFPGLGWLVSSNLLLHLGVVIALLGVLFAWAL